VHQVDAFAGLNNLQSTYDQQFTSYSSQSFSQNKYEYRENSTAMANTKESLGEKGIVTTNLIN